MPDDLRDYIICQKLGWTVTELYEQPSRVIDSFLLIMNIEAQHERQQQHGN